jgi:glycosyltransferase involved in cell wall biosynthesis
MTVSVIIPTYNRVESLKRAIQSVLGQTYQDFEIIVVDDHSTDNTPVLMSQFKDRRIKYIRLDKNSGGSLVPMRTGYANSKGKYIAVLDDDDYWTDDDKLYLQAMYLDGHNNCMLIGTDAIATNGGGRIIAWHRYPKTSHEIHEKMLQQNCFFHSSVVYRKNVIEKIGGYPSINSGFYNNMVNEYQMWMKMGLIGDLINLPIYGVGYKYPNKKYPLLTKIDFMFKQLSYIKEYKRQYPHYFKSCLFNIMLTIMEFPYLIKIKHKLRKYGSY